MALVYNEEQIMLRDAARDFLQERAPVSHLREIRDSGNTDGFSRELWTEIAEMGWSAIIVPEEHGGLGYGYTGLGIVLEECGRTLTPSPLLSTALIGATAITTAGTPQQCEAILPSVATGEHLLALACEETTQHQPGHIETEAVKTDDGYRISGRKLAVLDGHVADTLIVAARSEDAIGLFMVPADSEGVTIEPYPALDTHRAANVTFANVRVDPDALLGNKSCGQNVLDAILDAGRIGAAAEMLGLAQEAFERTLEYLRERKQFGVPIGVFQGLQHRAAHLFSELEMCKSLLIKVLQTQDAGSEELAQMASLAKAKVSETARLATAEAVQMHGGIGMTDEFDIGFYMKRWRVLEDLYGDRYFHLDRFALARGY